MQTLQQAEARHQDGRFEAAIEWYDKAIRMTKQDFVLHMALTNKGDCLRQLSRHKEAMACLDRAIALDADSEQGWYNKGQCLKDQNRFREAIACYDRAVAIEPDADDDEEERADLRRRQADGWTNRGFCLAELGEVEEAAASHAKAAELSRPPRPWWKFW